MAYAAAPDMGSDKVARAKRSLPRDARREAEFKRARRHSLTVAFLKFVFPLMAAGIVSLYALPSLLKTTIDNGRATVTARAITIEAGVRKIDSPHVTGVNDKGEPYDITAESARQDARTPGLMHLQTVRGKLTGLDGIVSTLNAPTAVHNSKTDDIEFNDGAVVTRDGGLSAEFQSAVTNVKGQMVTSKTPVLVRLHESTIKADNMTLYWSENRAIFEGNVKTHIVQEPDGAQQGLAGGEAGTSAAQPQ